MSGGIRACFLSESDAAPLLGLEVVRIGDECECAHHFDRAEKKPKREELRKEPIHYLRHLLNFGVAIEMKGDPGETYETEQLNRNNLETYVGDQARQIVLENRNTHNAASYPVSAKAGGLAVDRGESIAGPGDRLVKSSHGTPQIAHERNAGDDNAGYPSIWGSGGPSGDLLDGFFHVESGSTDRLHLQLSEIAA